MKHDLDITFQGLSEWYVSLFEKLGWMVIANHEGRRDKVRMYQDSLIHFLKKAENKYRSLKSQDKKDDIFIMMNKVIILLEHLEKDFSL
jgi:hypothetical protein